MMVLNWFYEIRSYIGAYGQHIKARWLLSLVWVLAISAMIWFYGDTLSFGTWRPLEAQRARLVAIGIAFAVWLAILLVRLVRARRADAALSDAVTADGRADPARAAADDVAEIRARLRTALKELRGKLGRGSVYSLPWYALIGPPGAGKTTALTNSGLNFPLADTIGDGPVEGVGGTRHCDWWFTEDSILIDTAGRYTAQDNEPEVERASWQGFLALLKKHRPRQPLNGALVMVGLDDILRAEPAERLRQARTIRKRLRELDEAFRLRVPAYLVLTKADRLAGFSAFFEHLDRPAREQVWGVTFPLPAPGRGGEGGLAARFASGLDGLVERLNGLLLDRLQAEADPQRRAEIFAFPSQVALLAEPLHEIMGEIGSDSRFDPAPRVRGVYFASAHQDRASLDFVSETTRSQFGVAAPDRAGEGDGTLEAGKSYFLARLLRDVVFNEASLVSTDPVRERRRRIARWAGAGAFAALVLALSGAWLLDYFGQERRLADTEARLGVYAAAAAAIPVADVRDADIGRALPALDEAAALVPPPEEGWRWAALHLPDQEPKVRAGANDVYRRALNGFLLPRLLVAVEGDLKRGGDAAATADALRLYPMLGARAAVDAPFATKALAGDVDRALPGDGRAPERADAGRKIAALLSGPLTPIALDPGAVAQAQAAGRVRERMAAWDKSGGALCRGAFEGHYPARAAADAGISQEDFTALFGPNGRFDSFFRETLAPLVDTGAHPWRWKDARPGAAGARDGLEAFERAAAIRDGFFGGANGALGITFDATPVSVAGASSVSMVLDGQQLDYATGDRGGPRPVALSWPSDAGSAGAEVSFRPGGPDAVLEHRGLWAPFHLLDAAQVQPSGTGGARVVFSAGARQATFDLHAETAANPFDLATLHGFNCPRAL